ncbi:TonB-dependent receptor [Sediminicola luteus]|uniref:TonB-dependent receptor plug domain-containing protein n=1 Tax=Sediminicola luteus TaxID=319238 RepID=A0A2A4GDS1_9FLAO|nr:TonB-dependent receptor plug domain-containing protein [Sediminicola luteus]PCE66727.1 hypothetical protein B7P33_05400 [Sediminicola luteus]
MPRTFQNLPFILFLCALGVFNTPLFGQELPTEKTFIHLPKDKFDTKEKIPFKVYIVDGDTGMSPISKVVYIEVLTLDKQSVLKKKLLVQGTSASGILSFPEPLDPGTYHLRAYTKFMEGSSGSHQNSIPLVLTDHGGTPQTPTQKPALRIHPEGGTLVANLPNRIGVKALYPYSVDVDAMLELVNSKGDILESIPFPFGLAKAIPFTPKEGGYTLRLVSQQRTWSYPLPELEAQGFTMRIIENPESYKLYIQTNNGGGYAGCQLKVAQKGLPDFVLPLRSTSPTIVLPLPKARLRPGLVHISLQDDAGQTPYEKTLFHQTGTLTQSAITIDVAEKGIQLAVKDSFKLADMSVSVHKLAGARQPYSNIGTHLQLATEFTLDETFAQVIDKNGLLDKSALDAELLASFKPISKDSTILYVPETGLELKGKVVSRRKNPDFEGIQAFMVTRSSAGLGFEESPISTTGEFSFQNLYFPSGAEANVKVGVAKRRKKDKVKFSDSYQIIIDSLLPTDFAVPEYDFDPRETQTQEVEGFSGDGITQLDEVTLETEVETKKQAQRRRQRSLYITPSETVEVTDQILSATNSIEELLQRKIPGLRVIEGAYYLRYSVTAGNLTPASIMLDGFFIDSADLNPIPIISVDYVDVIREGRTALFGRRGVGGVIAIYTKRGEKHDTLPPDRSGQVIVPIPGLADTDKLKLTKRKGDLIYWDPDFKMNSKGKHTIAMPSSLSAGYYLINVQGISANGTPLWATRKIYWEP